MYEATKSGKNARRIHQVQVRSGQVASTNPNRAALNPWALTLDTRRPPPDEDAKLFEDAIRAGIVDIHLDLAPGDWLRARLHATLGAEWHDLYKRMNHRRPPDKQLKLPPIARLLYGPHPWTAERSRAFLVLDALKGTFRIREFARTKPRTRRRPRVRMDTGHGSRLTSLQSTIPC